MKFEIASRHFNFLAILTSRLITVLKRLNLEEMTSLTICSSFGKRRERRLKIACMADSLGLKRAVLTTSVAYD